MFALCAIAIILAGFSRIEADARAKRRVLNAVKATTASESSTAAIHVAASENIHEPFPAPLSDMLSVSSGQFMESVHKDRMDSKDMDLLDDECPCTKPKIWLDIFFLIDASSAMTSSGFDYATAYVESVLYQMTVGQQFGQQTRVGFITYGADAKLHYNLSYWHSTNDLLNKMELPFHDTRGTNIEAGIRLATANFVPPHHRPNARKVIVIIASAFESGNYNDPSVAAETFKEDGGIIITVDMKLFLYLRRKGGIGRLWHAAERSGGAFEASSGNSTINGKTGDIEHVQVHGAPVTMLETLATPGYQLSNQHGKLDVNKLQQLFCKGDTWYIGNRETCSG